MKSIHSGGVTTKSNSPEVRKAQFRLAVRAGEKEIQIFVQNIKGTLNFHLLTVGTISDFHSNFICKSLTEF